MAAYVTSLAWRAGEVCENPLRQAIERYRFLWAEYLDTKPVEVRLIFQRLLTLIAVGDKFTRKFMLASIAEELENLEMARGKGSGKNVKQTSNWKENILNIPTTGHTVDDVREYYGEVSSLMDAMDAVIQAGYKLSISYNVANDNFIASLTGRLQGTANYEKTISGFAMTWDMAVAVVLYKHYVICGEGAWVEHAQRRMYGEIG
jgi:hypothetical protein